MTMSNGWIRALLLAASALSGCIAETHQIGESNARTSDDESPSAPPWDEPTPTRPPAEPAPAPGPAPAQAPARPVVFSGHILAPEPGMYEIGDCGGAFANLYQFSQALREGMWNGFGFTRGIYDNWTYAFNVDGLVASFGTHPGQSESLGPFGSMHSGRVPAGTSFVRICSDRAVDTYFNLTLTPPGPIVFYGHVYGPDPRLYVPGPKICHDFYDERILDGYEQTAAPVTSDTYNIGDSKGGRPYGGWSFRFDVPDMVASFRGGANAAPARSSGTVPSQAWSVHVCSTLGPESAYQLMFTPPS